MSWRRPRISTRSSKYSARFQCENMRKCVLKKSPYHPANVHKGTQSFVLRVTRTEKKCVCAFVFALAHSLTIIPFHNYSVLVSRVASILTANDIFEMVLFFLCVSSLWLHIHNITLRTVVSNLTFSENCFFRNHSEPLHYWTDGISCDEYTHSTSESKTIIHTYTHSPKADIDNFNFSNYFNAFSCDNDTFNFKRNNKLSTLSMNKRRVKMKWMCRVRVWWLMCHMC